MFCLVFIDNVISDVLHLKRSIVLRHMDGKKINMSANKLSNVRIKHAVYRTDDARIAHVLLCLDRKQNKRCNVQTSYYLVFIYC